MPSQGVLTDRYKQQPEMFYSLQVIIHSSVLDRYHECRLTPVTFLVRPASSIDDILRDQRRRVQEHRVAERDCSKAELPRFRRRQEDPRSLPPFLLHQILF
jgi:hypothetical protein